MQKSQSLDIVPKSDSLTAITTSRHAAMQGGFFSSANNPEGTRVMAEIIQTNSNGRGGARKGAGRKPGSLTTRTREIAENAAGLGITPLEYMLDMMRRDSDHEDPKIQAQREMMRFEAAKAAAPYVHPRLSSVEVDADVRVRSLAEELAALNAAAD